MELNVNKEIQDLMGRMLFENIALKKHVDLLLEQCAVQQAELEDLKKKYDSLLGTQE